MFLLLARFFYDSKLTLSCSNAILDGEVTGLREQGKFEEKYELTPHVCGKREGILLPCASLFKDKQLTLLSRIAVLDGEGVKNGEGGTFESGREKYELTLHVRGCREVRVNSMFLRMHKVCYYFLLHTLATNH
jgi:hypothetical protein